MCLFQIPSNSSSDVEEPILFQAPPTPPTPTTPPVIIPGVEDSLEKSESPKVPFRHRSPPVLTNRPGSTPPPNVSRSFSVRQKGRGQTSVVRQLVYVDDDEDELAIEKRRKHQERLSEAQSIQREMSQIELQYEELEEIAREVEQNLRDSEGSEFLLTICCFKSFLCT